MNHHAYEQHIEQAYRQFGFKQGYRHWYHPRDWVDSCPQVLVMPINPGAGGDWANHGRYSQEKGSAYLVEDWGPNSLVQDPLPRILRMANLDVKTVAYANWMPFRSGKVSDITDLSHWPYINRWCIDLWRQLLAEMKPRLILSFGTIPRKGLGKVLGKPRSTCPEKIPGKCFFQLDHYPERQLRVMTLPYPKTQQYSLLKDPVLPTTQKWMGAVARVLS